MLSQQTGSEPSEMEIVPAEIEIVMVEDLLLPPGRYGRPSKIVVILRGLPGSGKSHLARSIKVCFQFVVVVQNSKRIFLFPRKRRC